MRNVKIDEFIPKLKETFSQSDDLKCRELTVAGTRCVFCYIDGGTDKLLLEQNIILPLRNTAEFGPPYLDALNATDAAGIQLRGRGSRGRRGVYDRRRGRLLRILAAQAGETRGSGAADLQRS